jgi:hypothetical protein
LLIQKCQDFRSSKAFVSAIFEFVKFPTSYEWSNIRRPVTCPMTGDWGVPFLLFESKYNIDERQMIPKALTKLGDAFILTGLMNDP